MTNEQKQNAMIEMLGSVQAYNRLVFEKIPPDFYIVLDSNGDITVPNGSIAEYLKRGMANGLSYEEIKERDLARFSKITDDLYSELILNAQN